MIFSMKVNKKAFFTVTPLSKTIALILFVGLPFLGFYLGILYQRSLRVSSPVPSRAPMVSVSGSFSGKMPCADCSGIDETLTINENGTYTLKDVYEGKSVEPFVEDGRWEVDSGKVLELDTKEGQPQYFLIVNENTLRMLNSEKEEIDSPFNETLVKSST